MSYSYYLIHAPVLHVVLYAVSHGIRNWATAPMVWAILFVSLAATWIASTVLYVAIEKPLSFAAASTDGRNRAVLSGNATAAARRPSPSPVASSGE